MIDRVKIKSACLRCLFKNKKGAESAFSLFWHILGKEMTESQYFLEKNMKKSLANAKICLLFREKDVIHFLVRVLSVRFGASVAHKVRLNNFAAMSSATGYYWKQAQYIRYGGLNEQ